MFNIQSSKSQSETMSILHKAFHEDASKRWAGTGFVGKVDLDRNCFWLMDKKNVYTKGRSYKYYAYRRFEASVENDGSLSKIIGVYKILPLYRYTMIAYYVFISFITLFLIGSAIKSGEYISLIQALIPMIIMYLMGFGTIVFNLRKAKPYEGEIIEYLSDLVKDETQAIMKGSSTINWL